MNDQSEEKKLFRFSKKVTVFCIIANAAITAALIILMACQIQLDGMVVAAMYAPFSLELGYNCMIAIVEKKGSRNETE